MKLQAPQPYAKTVFDQLLNALTDALDACLRRDRDVVLTRGVVVKMYTTTGNLKQIRPKDDNTIEVVDG